ncbi:25416_t:CDS:2, partial [Gigaspora rosea]
SSKITGNSLWTFMILQGNQKSPKKAPAPLHVLNHAISRLEVKSKLKRENNVSKKKKQKKNWAGIYLYPISSNHQSQGESKETTRIIEKVHYQENQKSPLPRESRVQESPVVLCGLF